MVSGYQTCVVSVEFVHNGENNEASQTPRPHFTCLYVGICPSERSQVIKDICLQVTDTTLCFW